MAVKKLIKQLFQIRKKSFSNNNSERLKLALTKKEIYQNKLKLLPDDKKIILKINILDLIINYLCEVIKTNENK